MHFKDLAFYVVIAMLAISADQISKNYLIHFFANGGEAFVVIPHTFNIVSVWNKGISFGMLSGIVGINIVICILVSIVNLALLWLVKKSHKSFERIALILIISGSLGNLLDRARFGAVFDFIDLYYQKFHWPAFNLADSFVFFGVTMAFVAQICIKKQY